MRMRKGNAVHAKDSGRKNKTWCELRAKHISSSWSNVTCPKCLAIGRRKRINGKVVHEKRN